MHPSEEIYCEKSNRLSGKTIVLGITGSIACGKSTVSGELQRRGYPVIDGDLLAREITGSDGAAIREIRSFNSSCLFYVIST